MVHLSSLRYEWLISRHVTNMLDDTENRPESPEKNPRSHIEINQSQPTNYDYEPTEDRTYHCANLTPLIPPT